MEGKEIEKKEKKKIEIDSFGIISIIVMVLSVAIALYFLLSFGK